MTLFMIGIGLWDRTDISVKGLEIVRKCDSVYLESYTSRLDSTVDELEAFYGKKVISADREMVESGTEIIDDAKERDVAFLVIGDVFGATTHTDLRLRGAKAGIDVRIIHNASILSAIGISGLELYKFGRITSIPFYNENINSPVRVLKENNSMGLHTLFLLDLEPDKNRYMTVGDAASYLMANGLSENTLAVGCAGIGSDAPGIKAKPLGELKSEKFTLFPQCLIIPGKLHFVEEKALKTWK